jgi:hypothetical protein
VTECDDDELILEYFDGCIERWFCPKSEEEFEIDNAVLCYYDTGEGTYLRVDHCDCLINSYIQLYNGGQIPNDLDECGCDFSYLIDGNICDDDPVDIQFVSSSNSILMTIRDRATREIRFSKLDQELNQLSTSSWMHFEYEIRDARILRDSVLFLAGSNGNGTIIQAIYGSTALNEKNWVYTFPLELDIASIMEDENGSISLITKHNDSSNYFTYLFDVEGKLLRESEINNSKSVEIIKVIDDTCKIVVENNLTFKSLKYFKNDVEVLRKDLAIDWAVKAVFLDRDDIVLFVNISGFQKIGEQEYDFNNRNGLVIVRLDSKGNISSSRALMEELNNSFISTKIERLSLSKYAVIGYSYDGRLGIDDVVDDTYDVSESMCSMLTSLDLGESESIKSQIVTRSSSIDYAIRVIPNPFNSTFSINLSGYDIYNLNIDLLDYNGRILTQKNSLINDENDIITFNGSNLSQGIYFIRITSSDVNEILKIVKN